MEVAPVIIHLFRWDGIFHDINHPAAGGGYPHDELETPICQRGLVDIF